MDIFNQVYNRSLAENEKHLRFWDDYLKSLKNLDFNIFNEKLKVPALVPIGSRILFRGELKHTNEVTIALGADYFVKCSLKQAEVIRQHRINVAQTKLNEFMKEKEYLENQLSLARQTFNEPQGKEIIEYQSTEEDKAWREKHRENMRQYRQKKVKDESPKEEITDEELWNRLEELELQEELENELAEMNENQNIPKLKSKQESIVVKEEESIKIKEPKLKFNEEDNKSEHKEPLPKKVSFKEVEAPKQNSKYEMLQQVIDRQNELEERLQELKNKERGQTKNEKDLISRLDELEQLDELEDEMDRLDDIIENEDTEDESTDEEANKVSKSSPKRQVSFAEEDDAETLELTFKHSPIEPNNEPYDPKKGIQKPSDIYEVYSRSFGTASILKKSKYGPLPDMPVVMNKAQKVMLNQDKIHKSEENEMIKNMGQMTEERYAPRTIVVNDVVEKVTPSIKKVEMGARPTSLFKKKRMQNKS